MDVVLARRGPHCNPLDCLKPAGCSCQSNHLLSHLLYRLSRGLDLVRNPGVGLPPLRQKRLDSPPAILHIQQWAVLGPSQAAQDLVGTAAKAEKHTAATHHFPVDWINQRSATSSDDQVGLGCQLPAQATLQSPEVGLALGSEYL